jgi:hypothetical protein
MFLWIVVQSHLAIQSQSGRCWLSCLSRRRSIANRRAWIIGRSQTVWVEGKTGHVIRLADAKAGQVGLGPKAEHAADPQL